MSQHTVALDIVTLVRLREYRARLELAVLKHPDGYPKWLQKGRPSLDDAVSFLLDQQASHSRRAEKSKVARTHAGEGTIGRPEDPAYDYNIAKSPLANVPPGSEPLSPPNGSGCSVPRSGEG